MRVELINLHRRLNATMVYVTHDQIEAMTLANRIAVLNQGRLEQLGTPLDIYHSPRNIFVAGFIGSPKMNFLDVRATAVDNTGITVGLPGNLPLKIPVSGDNVEAGSELKLGVRPEHLGLGEGVNGPADATMKAHASVVEHLGGEIFVHAQLADQSSLVLTSAGYNEIAQSDHIDIGVRASLCHLFGADGMALSPITERAASA
jgi:multiple sugar transport system ATP-binding protein